MSRDTTTVTPVHDLDDDDAPDIPVDALTLRRPDTPTTITQLAALGGDALDIIEARVQIIQTLRVASIRTTYPEDWLLFKTPEQHGGQIVCYLQDAGCDRVRDLWGINVFNVSKPEKISGAQQGVFHYLMSGSGKCKFTTQVVESMEGGRSSTDDFCKGKEGAELELLVRKACRANLDGNITRELAGMKNVPLDELKAAWTGTSKRIEQCRLGRGFGTADERVGGASAKAPNVEPPICGICQTPAVFRPGKDGRGAFYGCPNYKNHSDKKWSVDAEKWATQQRAAAATTAATRPPAAAPAPAAPAPAATGSMPSAGDVFGTKARQPGQEG